jgi:hypothetical protein
VLADVRLAVGRLVSRHAGVREVWLFGSLARGDATPRSDVDLLVVVDTDDRRPLDRIPDVLRGLEGLGRSVDVVVLTVAEWERRADTRFHREVTGGGLRLA